MAERDDAPPSPPIAVGGPGTDPGPLAWLREALEHTLDATLAAVRQYVAAHERSRAGDLAAVDDSELRWQVQALHQAAGALDMVELPAEARTVAALQAVLERLVQRPLAAEAAVLPLVERGVWALRDQLQRHLRQQGLPGLTLFPTYRDWQQWAQGRPHPADLWGASLPPAVEPPPGPTVAPGPRVRTHLERLALPLLREGRPSAAAALARLAGGVSRAVDDGAQRRFWLIAAAVFEGLAAQRLPLDVWAKRALAALLRQLAAEGGDGAPSADEAASARWDAAAREWLYLAARIDPAPDDALRHAAVLWRAMGWQAPLRWDPEQRVLGAVDPQTVARVQAAAADVQRRWEAADAQGGTTPPTAAVAALADALADGPDPWPALADAWRAWAAHPEAAGAPSSEPVLALLGLQAELESVDPLDPAQAGRLRTLADRLRAAASGQALPPPPPWLSERYRVWSEREGARRLAAEWRHELAALEAAFEALWRQGDAEAWTGLRAVPQRLQRLRGHAALMNMPAVADALTIMDKAVTEWLAQGALPAPAERQAQVERLGANLAALGAWIDVWEREAALAAQTFRFDAEAGVLRAVQAAATAVRAEPAAADASAEAPAVTDAESDAPDIDERAIFLAEARDLLAGMATALDALRAAPGDQAALARLRRLFHTLKGSARLVGLTALGEAAWQAERRLNTWLAEARPLAPAERDAIAAAHACLVPWVDAWAHGGPPADEARRLAEVEAALQRAEPEAAQPPATTEPAPIPVPMPAPIHIGPLVLDPELYQVFLQEADAHSLALEQTLDDWADGVGGAGAAGDVQAAAERAHALAGQAATIGHAPLAALARALEEALLRAATHPAPLANDRAVVARAARELRGLLHQLAAGCYREPAADTLSALADWPPAPTNIAPDTPAVLDDFRAEVADLLPRLSAALARWADRGDGAAQAELLRLLHTAKGGARLAGLAALAEQAHALEAQVLAVPADGPVPAALRRVLGAWMAQAEQAGCGDSAEPPPAAPAPRSPLSASAPPPPSPAPGEPEPVLRVRADLIERLLAGVTDQLANRQRLGGELGALRRSLRDMAANVERLRQQWRELQRQTESQTPARVSGPVPDGFDALELDRYTRVQELTRLLAESIDDVATVQHQMQRAVAAAEGHLAAQERQARVGQRALLEARLVPFDSMAERLARGLRQAAEARGRTVEWHLEGGAAVLDRAVLERLVPVLEHLLRNAVVHGIESPEARVAAGKPPAGRIALALQVQGQDLSLTLTDDGAGLDLEGLRRRAVAAGLHPADAPFTRGDAVRCALAPGISTATQVDEWAGRGIGLDAVRSELLALGGRIEGFEPAGGGTGWHLVVPLTTAITAVVLVRVDDRVIGLPVPWVEAVRRVHGPELTAAELAGQWREGAALMPLFWLGALLGVSPRPSPRADRRGIPVLECHSAGRRVALRVDAVLGRQTVVLRPLPPLLARQPGLAGASVLPDGGVVLIYHPLALMAEYGEGARQWAADAGGTPAVQAARSGSPPAVAPLVLVVDDSITVRRVTQRLLRRAGYRVALAGDGVQALERLREEAPVVVLSDIEMPRMDGFELVRALRNDPRWTDLPVVMVTSRLADKHRAHAESLGVNHYLGKPYAEDELLALVAAYARLAPPGGRGLSPS